eukprot:3940380-Rhodomonas_salina.1
MSAIVLPYAALCPLSSYHMRHALSSTDIAYAIALPSFLAPYVCATQCPVLTSRMLLPGGGGAGDSRGSSPPPMVLRTCYAMSGTEIAYAPTRRSPRTLLRCRFCCYFLLFCAIFGCFLLFFCLCCAVSGCFRLFSAAMLPFMAAYWLCNIVSLMTAMLTLVAAVNGCDASVNHCNVSIKGCDADVSGCHQCPHLMAAVNIFN